MTFILDNRDRRVGDFLRERIATGARLSIVSAYFTIYAYEALRDSLEGASAVRFLYGEPRGVGEMDPAEGESRAFRLTDDGGIALKHALAQRALARDCAAWIERLVEIRTVARSGFLHGKAVHIAPPEGGSGAAVVAIVDRILSARRADPQGDVSALERELDGIVHGLYDFES